MRRANKEVSEEGGGRNEGVRREELGSEERGAME